MNASDQELIQQLLSNIRHVRETSWEYVYRTYYPMIREMVRNQSGSDEDSVDIFQDGLLIFNCNLRNGSFRNDSVVSTYIYSICKNLWLKEYSRRNKQSLLEPELLIETQQNFNTLINVEIVTLLMNELKEDCRKILTEYYFNNRSMAELKEIFNVNSVQAAKNKKWRCLNYLITLFKEKRVVPTWG